MKRFAVKGTDKIEENEFGAFVLYAEAQKEIEALTQQLRMAQQRVSGCDICHCPAYCHYHGNKVFYQQKAALQEIFRNCETFRRADTVADRLCKIVEEGLREVD